MSFAQLIEITKQVKHVKGELERFAFLFNAQFKKLPLPLFLLDTQGTIERVNANGLDTLGRAEADLVGRPFTALCAPKGKDDCEALMQQCLEQPDQSHILSTRLIHGDNEQRTYHLIGQAGELGEEIQPKILLYCRRTGVNKADEEAIEALLRAPATGHPPASAIPTDRMVLGCDLETLQKRLNSSAQRCCALLGIRFNIWSDWKREPDKPIPNPGVCLLIRLLDAFPFLAEVPYSADNLRDALTRKYGRRFTKTEVALMLGRQASAYTRWGTRSAPTDVIVNLTAFLVELLETEPLGAFDYYRELVEREARARGIKNLWEERTWRTREVD